MSDGFVQAEMVTPRQAPLPQAHAAKRESLGDLVRRLIDDVSGLVRSEFRLARSEMRDSVISASGGMAAIAAGGMMISVAMFCLLGAAVAYLARYVGIVMAAVIVASVAIAIGAVLIWFGINRLKSVDFAAPRLVARLSADAETLKGE